MRQVFKLSALVHIQKAEGNLTVAVGPYAQANKEAAVAVVLTLLLLSLTLLLWSNCHCV